MREYFLKDGTKVSGVTTIINSNLGWNKQQLMYWAWNCGKEGINYKEESKKATDAGTIAHQMIEADLKNIPFAAPECDKEIVSKAETAFINWLEWKDRMQFKLVHSELSLVSEEHRFGGTIDFIPEIQGKLSIFDFKTSNDVYAEYLLQVSAYQKLAKENGIEVNGGIHILLLNKEDASFKHFYWHALPEAWDAFLCALKLHELHKKLKKR